MQAIFHEPPARNKKTPARHGGLAGVLSIQLGSCWPLDRNDQAEPATSHLSADSRFGGPTLAIILSYSVSLSHPTKNQLIEDRVHIVPDHVAMSQADIP